MALSSNIELNMNLPIIDSLIPSRIRAKEEARQMEEQLKFDGLKARTVALQRLPKDQFKRLPTLKTPYKLNTPSLGGNSEIIVDSENPESKSVKLRLLASRIGVGGRYISHGTVTLNIDTDGNSQITFLEKSRSPFENKIMRREDYIIGNDSTPASLSHRQFQVITSAIETGGELSLSDAASTYKGLEIPLQGSAMPNQTDNMIILPPPQLRRESSAA